jgi:uncharacterized protein
MTAYPAAIAFAAFMAGLLGSAHCVAMCGGIAGAMCRGASGTSGSRMRPLAYQVGRIASYTIAGALVGTLGYTGIALKGGVHSGHYLLYAAGIALIVMALYVAGYAPLVTRIEAMGSVIWKRIQPYSRGLLPANTVPRALGLGLVWGWLPCGMVYSALLTAAALADPLQSAAVMLAFGLGTLPSMLAVTVFAVRLRAWTQLRPARYAASGLILLFGVFAIVKAAHAAAFPVEGALCLVRTWW